MGKSLTRNWQTLINPYIPSPEVLINELKRTPIVDLIPMDKKWLGPSLTYPAASGPKDSYEISFLGNEVGNTNIGGLVPMANISIAEPVRGIVQDSVDYLGAVKVLGSDYDNFKGSDSDMKASLKMKIVRLIESAMQSHKQGMEYMVACAGVISTVTDVTNKATGILVVKNFERLKKDQYIQFASAGATTKKGSFHVKAINQATGAVTFSATIGDAAADLTNYINTIADSYVCVPGSVDAAGAITYSMDSLRSILLPSSAGGSASYLGITKTNYDFLQAAYVDGTSIITASNFLGDLYETYATKISLRVKSPDGKKPTKCAVSTQNWVYATKELEQYKGQFNVTPGEKKSNPYGYDYITVGGTKAGSFDIVKVDTLLDTDIMFINPDNFTIASNGGYKYKNTINASGQYDWFPVRVDNGDYTYVLDYGVKAQLVCNNPQGQGFIKVAL